MRLEGEWWIGDPLLRSRSCINKMEGHPTTARGFVQLALLQFIGRCVSWRNQFITSKLQLRRVGVLIAGHFPPKPHLKSVRTAMKTCRLINPTVEQGSRRRLSQWRPNERHEENSVGN
jgi:hypothetical protein